MDTTIAERQESTRLADAVRRLPLPYRQVVVLLLEGLEYREIAEVLGISESNVGVRLNRARQLPERRSPTAPVARPPTAAALSGDRYLHVQRSQP